jgi:hypothetical protein
VKPQQVDQLTLRRRGTGLIAADPDAASPGYTLFAPLTGTGQVYLVGLDGTVAHQWDLPYRPGCHARLLPNGNLAYNGVLPGQPALFPGWLTYRGGVFCEADPSGAIVREHRDELQHCPSELPDGKLLLFDNGTFRDGENVPYSRVIEVDRRTRAITWEYRDSPPENFFTALMGAAQRLANGNTLITESMFGRVFEVDRDRRVCWEYVVPYFSAYHDEETARLFPEVTNAVFRAYRYTPDEVPWLRG